MWKATDVEPAFVDKPFAPRVGVSLQRKCLTMLIIYSFFFSKKTMQEDGRVGRGTTAPSRAGTETRTSRSRATMAPTLRPRTPKKGVDASGATLEGDGTRSRRGTSRDEKSRDGGPKARSFALSSSGWLFVYYVGVVKALAERGYHKCVLLSYVVRCSYRSPDVDVGPRDPLSFKCARISTTDARRGIFFGGLARPDLRRSARRTRGEDPVGRPKHRTRHRR